MKYHKIKDLSSEKNISLKHLAVKIGLSEQGLHSSIRNETLKIDTLEKIASALGVSVCDFFDIEIPNQTELQKQLAEKEKYIKVLEEHIELLKDIRKGRIK